MNNSSLFRIGGIAAILGVLFLFGAVAIPLLLGIVNAIVNIAGGGDWTQIANPTLKLLSNLTYYPGSLLVTAWLVWAGVALLRSKAALQQQPA